MSSEHSSSLDGANRCATCKHRSEDFIESFRYDDDYNDLPVTYYACKRILHGNGGRCLENYKPGEHALVVDGSGYHARFIVEADFGCVLWEPK